MKRIMSCLLSLCTIGISGAAHAQSGPPANGGARPPGDTVTVGFGLGISTSYDGARDYRIIPGGALLGTIEGHDFRLNGLQLFVDAIPNDPRRRIDMELGPVAGVDFNRTGNVSNSRVEALGDLKTAVELGARGSVGVRGIRNRADKLAIAVTSVWDVAGAHRSHVITPSIEYSTVVTPRTFIRLALTGEFVGRGWANYNFGIDSVGAAASGLAPYSLKGGFGSLGTNILTTYSLSGRRTGWTVFGVASYKRLQGEIAASPIVRDTGSANQAFGSIGIGYTF